MLTIREEKKDDQEENYFSEQEKNAIRKFKNFYKIPLIDALEAFLNGEKPLNYIRTRLQFMSYKERGPFTKWLLTHYKTKKDLKEKLNGREAFILGFAYWSGLGVNEDEQYAKRCFEIMTQEADTKVAGYYALAELYLVGKSNNNVEIAKAYLQQINHVEDPVKDFLMYRVLTYKGPVQDTDYAKALFHLMLAGNSRYAGALYTIGWLITSPYAAFAVPPNNEEALDYLLQAMEEGHVLAVQQIADLYHERTNDIDLNKARAALFYRLSGARTNDCLYHAHTKFYEIYKYYRFNPPIIVDYHLNLLSMHASSPYYNILMAFPNWSGKRFFNKWLTLSPESLPAMMSRAEDNWETIADLLNDQVKDQFHNTALCLTALIHCPVDVTFIIMNYAFEDGLALAIQKEKKMAASSTSQTIASNTVSYVRSMFFGASENQNRPTNSSLLTMCISSNRPS